MTLLRAYKEHFADQLNKNQLAVIEFTYTTIL